MIVFVELISNPEGPFFWLLMGLVCLLFAEVATHSSRLYNLAEMTEEEVVVLLGPQIFRN